MCFANAFHCIRLQKQLREYLWGLLFTCTFSTEFISCSLTSGAFQKTQSICFALKSREVKENYFTKKSEYLPIGIILHRGIINPIFKLGDANFRSSKCRRTHAHAVKLHQIHLFECWITPRHYLDRLLQEGIFSVQSAHWTVTVRQLIAFIETWG